MNTKIIADTGSDLSEKLVDELNIDMMSVIITHNDKEYKDRIDIQADEIFRKQREGESFTTSQIPLFGYFEKFEQYAKEGQDFIYISLSSGLTGGYNNAVFAVRELKEKYPDVRMAAVDSKAASVGYGLSLYLLAKMAKNDADFDELIEFSEYLSKNIRHAFTVFDMEYLYKGGRISRAQKSIGKLLNIRPIIIADSDGKLTVQELSRGNKVYKRMVEVIKEETHNRDLSNDIFMPVYGEDKEITDIFIKKLESLEDAPKLNPQRLGSSIGVHTGPDIIGIAYLANEIPEKFRGRLQ